jgi:hypothetical protein
MSFTPRLVQLILPFANIPAIVVIGRYQQTQHYVSERTAEFAMNLRNKLVLRAVDHFDS